MVSFCRKNLGVNSTSLYVDSSVTINAKAEVVKLTGWQYYMHENLGSCWFVLLNSCCFLVFSIVA